MAMALNLKSSGGIMNHRQTLYHPDKMVLACCRHDVNIMDIVLCLGFSGYALAPS